MKRLFTLIFISLVVLSFCVYKLVQISHEAETLTLIAEIDGCKLYLVKPQYVYWSTCEGSTQWSEHSGRQTVTKQVITKRIKSNE